MRRGYHPPRTPLLGHVAILCLPVLGTQIWDVAIPPRFGIPAQYSGIEPVFAIPVWGPGVARVMEAWVMGYVAIPHYVDGWHCTAIKQALRCVAGGHEDDQNHKGPFCLVPSKRDHSRFVHSRVTWLLLQGRATMKFLCGPLPHVDHLHALQRFPNRKIQNDRWRSGQIVFGSNCQTRLA